MWSRAELKERAKNALRQNYWKTVLVTLIVFFIGGATTTFNFSSKSSDSDVFSEFEQIWEENFSSAPAFEFDTIYMTTGGEASPDFGGEDDFPNEESAMIDFGELSDMEYSDQHDFEDVSDVYLKGYKDGYSGQERVTIEAGDYSDGYNDGVLDNYAQNVLNEDAFLEDTFIDSDISYLEDGAFGVSSTTGNFTENSSGIAIVGRMLVIILVVAVVALIGGVFFSVLIFNPLEVGTERFFVQNLNTPAEMKKIILIKML